MMRTVLNVDDTAANRYLKSRALRQAGFRRAVQGHTTIEEILAVVADQE